MSIEATAIIARIRTLDASQLHDHAIDARRRLTRAKHELCCLLRVIDQRATWRSRGCASLVEYAERELDLHPRLVTELVRLGRRLEDLPELHQAFATGELSWTKVRELARVATRHSEDAWLERAMQLTSRELEREVAICEPGDEPPHPDDLAQEPAPERVRLVFDVATTDAQVVRQALAQLRAAAGEEEIEPGVLLAEMARVALEASDESEAPVCRERYRVVLQQCTSCGRRTHVGQLDGDHRVADAVAGEANCDSEVVDARPGPNQWTASRTIPPRVRREVEHRDNHRCVVPGCRSHLWLDLHHLKPRAEGGENTAENLVVACPAHHRMAHEKRIVIRRGENGLEVERAPAIPVDEPLLPPLLELLESWSMQESEIGSFLGATVPQVRTVMEWCEKRGEVVRLPGGAWRRLAA